MRRRNGSCAVLYLDAFTATIILMGNSARRLAESWHQDGARLHTGMSPAQDEAENQRRTSMKSTQLAGEHAARENGFLHVTAGWGPHLQDRCP